MKPCGQGGLHSSWWLAFSSQRSHIICTTLPDGPESLKVWLFWVCLFERDEHEYWQGEGEMTSGNVIWLLTMLPWHHGTHVFKWEKRLCSNSVLKQIFYFLWPWISSFPTSLIWALYLSNKKLQKWRSWGFVVMEVCKLLTQKGEQEARSQDMFAQRSL